MALKSVRQPGSSRAVFTPILMRLNERGMLDSCWLEPERPGRPPRHGYRLTAKGAETLREAQANRVAAGMREALA